MSHVWAVTNSLAPLTSAAFTWSAGPSDATRAYLCDGRLDKQFESASAASSVNVIIDLGSAQELSLLALLNTNVRDAVVPKVLVEAADNAGMSTNLVTPRALTTLNIANYYEQTSKDHVIQLEAATRRYWRITWSWTGTFSLKVGEIFGASRTTSTELSRQAVWGASDASILKTVTNETVCGEKRAAIFGGPLREKRMRFQDLSLSEGMELKTMWHTARGPVLPVLWVETKTTTASGSAQPASEQECLYGRLASDSFTLENPDYGLYQPGEFVLRSLGREVGA